MFPSQLNMMSSALALLLFSLHAFAFQALELEPEQGLLGCQDTKMYFLERKQLFKSVRTLQPWPLDEHNMCCTTSAPSTEGGFLVKWLTRNPGEQGTLHSQTMGSCSVWRPGFWCSGCTPHIGHISAEVRVQCLGHASTPGSGFGCITLSVVR
ncbi:hypothetical protein ILYODFUR_011263 [Ilyodon furcidens]|uniref:Uncharacterized protein n=1 Tax=Ilyodon furcidens TaxID=33524 RepID=A0ABV0UF67_9TELE